MLTALILGLLLSVLVAEIHFESFNLISKMFSGISMRLRMLLVFFSILVTHVAEIIMYALVIYLLQNQLGFGGFTKEFEPTIINYVYYSAVSYTTVGISSFNATGPLKIIGSLESLTGFMLITWSASFAYSSFGSFWKQGSGSGA